MATKTAPAPKTTSTKSKGAVKVNIRPLHDKIIVLRDEAEDRTATGLYLPEQAKDTPKSGVIQAVGTGKLNTETGQRIPLTVKVGDRVIFSSYAGTEVKLEGTEVLVMSEDEILAIVD